jgi:formate C-acetyltransferase
VENAIDIASEREVPDVLCSCLTQDCLGRGKTIKEGGAVYDFISGLQVGIANMADSLSAIKKLVYDEKKLTLSALLSILRNNWEGEEVLRQYVLNRYTYYGNDNDEADGIAARLLSDFADICTSCNDRCGYRFPAGVSTFGRQLEWSPNRLASPHGRRIGEYADRRAQRLRRRLMMGGLL